MDKSIQNLEEGQENTDALTKEKLRNFFKGTKETSRSANATATKSPFESDVYDFSYPRRGLAVIINNKTFINPKYDRHGSEIDVIRLTKMFTCYGFDVIMYQDLTVGEIVDALKLVSAFPDHARADCFACAICSHGDEVTLPGESMSRDAIMGVRGDLVLTKVLIEIFTDRKCPGLIGKPRLFFMQACRGDLLDEGQLIQVSKLTLNPKDEVVSSCTDAKVTESDKGNNSHPLSAPLYPHFLVMYASPPGHAAWRRDDGSWFIKCLADTFLSLSLERTSLTTALTRVCSAVSRLQSKAGKKQVPCLVSKLIKDIYFSVKKMS